MVGRAESESSKSPASSPASDSMSCRRSSGPALRSRLGPLHHRRPISPVSAAWRPWWCSSTISRTARIPAWTTPTATTAATAASSSCPSFVSSIPPRPWLPCSSSSPAARSPTVAWGTFAHGTRTERAPWFRPWPFAGPCGCICRLSLPPSSPIWRKGRAGCLRKGCPRALWRGSQAIPGCMWGIWAASRACGAGKSISMDYGTIRIYGRFR